MNNPKTPYHAISNFDTFGSRPQFVGGLPREEDDFATQSEAERWLLERGGGTVEQHDGKAWKLVATCCQKEAEGPPS